MPSQAIPWGIHPGNTDLGSMGRDCRAFVPDGAAIRTRPVRIPSRIPSGPTPFRYALRRFPGLGWRRAGSRATPQRRPRFERPEIPVLPVLHAAYASFAFSRGVLHTLDACGFHAPLPRREHLGIPPLAFESCGAARTPRSYLKVHHFASPRVPEVLHMHRPYNDRMSAGTRRMQDPIAYRVGRETPFFRERS